MLVAQRALIDLAASDGAALLSRVAALRELRDVVVERTLAPGDTVRISGRVDATTPLPDDHELLSTSWEVVNAAGETVASAHADVVCRRPRQAAAGPSEAYDDVDIAQIPV